MTPTIAAFCVTALPDTRPVICGLGGTNLTRLATNWSTKTLIHIAAEHLPLLREIGWRADLFVIEDDGHDWTQDAMDLMTERGEGMVLTPHTLLGGPMQKHIWAHLQLDEGHAFYFAKGHRCGPRFFECATSAEALAGAVQRIDRLSFRFGGMVLRDGHAFTDTVPGFKVVTDEMERWARGDATPDLTMGHGGAFVAKLTPFKQRSNRWTKAQREALLDLNGRQPIQCVFQPAVRDRLLRIITSDGWCVQPEVASAVEGAIAARHEAQAPLLPMTPAMRVAFMEEQTEIKCLKSLGPFTAGTTYPMRPRLIMVERLKWKPNLRGELEEFLLSGIEMAIAIQGGDGAEHCFVDARVRQEGVLPNSQWTAEFTLHELVGHFEIPEVKSVAELNAGAYQANLERLNEIETIMNAG